MLSRTSEPEGQICYPCQDHCEASAPCFRFQGEWRAFTSANGMFCLCCMDLTTKGKSLRGIINHKLYRWLIVDSWPLTVHYWITPYILYSTSLRSAPANIHINYALHLICQVQVLASIQAEYSLEWLQIWVGQLNFENLNSNHWSTNISRLLLAWLWYDDQHCAAFRSIPYSVFEYSCLYCTLSCY